MDLREQNTEMNAGVVSISPSNAFLKSPKRMF